MEGVLRTPALPWAIPDAVERQQPLQQQELTYLAIQDVGLTLGLHIEVGIASFRTFLSFIW
jgi:hypothetical protein